MASRAAARKMATATALVLLVLLLCVGTSPVTACSAYCDTACLLFAQQICVSGVSCNRGPDLVCVYDAKKLCVTSCIAGCNGGTIKPCCLIP